MSFSWEDLQRRMEYDEALEQIAKAKKMVAELDKRLAHTQKRAYESVWKSYVRSHDNYSSRLDESRQMLQKGIQVFQTHLRSSNKPGPKARQFLLDFCIDHKSRREEIKITAENLEQIIQKEGHFSDTQVRKARHDAKTSTVTEEVFKARLRRLWLADRWMGLEYHYPKLFDEACPPSENTQAMKHLTYNTVQKLSDLPPLISDYRSSNLKAEREALRQLTTHSWHETGFSPQTRHLVRYWARRETLDMTLALASSSAARRCYSALERAARRLF